MWLVMVLYILSASAQDYTNIKAKCKVRTEPINTRSNCFLCYANCVEDKGADRFEHFVIEHQTFDHSLQPDDGDRKCVPTATAHGACHTCICAEDGSYHCKAKQCETTLLKMETADSDDSKAGAEVSECEPLAMYRNDTLWCSCSQSGSWKTSKCRMTFQKVHQEKHNTRTANSDITCETGNYYAVDCNICSCVNGNIGECTTRNCTKGHKSDPCKYGDVLKQENQLCACTSTGVFADNLCVTITNDNLTELTKVQLEILTLDDKFIPGGGKCRPDQIIEMDCNKCKCTKNGRLMCTDKMCLAQPRAEISRANQPKHGLKPLRNKLNTLPKLKSDKQRCTPGQLYRFNCNTCYCTNQGLPSCTTMLCMNNYVKNKNATGKRPYGAKINIRPEIINKLEKCTPEHVYKLECNLCKCTKNQTLLCTKLACLNDIEQANLDGFVRNKSTNSNNAVRNRGRKKNADNLTDLEEKCLPGNIYNKSDCERCFCNDRHILSCSDKLCKSRSNLILTPDDVAPKIHVKETNLLPSLPNQATKCEPGKSYRVDCNACFCLLNGNLLCQKMLCPSFDDANRLNAAEHNGADCTGNSEPTDCVKCLCKNGKTDCKYTENCIPAAYRRSLHGPIVSYPAEGLALISDTDECIPFMVYKLNCNKCYCQEDKSLRCTRKVCLSNTIMEKLKKTRQKLLLEDSTF